jgi:hypothetical protein
MPAICLLVRNAIDESGTTQAPDHVKKVGHCPVYTTYEYLNNPLKPSLLVR